MPFSLDLSSYLFLNEWTNTKYEVENNVIFFFKGSELRGGGGAAQCFMLQEKLGVRGGQSR
ncbi:MAG: hypothetical protein EA353_10920 [Puniceicoccaceae bacterium]|nr:MAG: hypothetical protein EA353_10920 [Puniceicoccaceae bacterium]